MNRKKHFNFFSDIYYQITDSAKKTNTVSENLEPRLNIGEYMLIKAWSKYEYYPIFNLDKYILCLIDKNEVSHNPLFPNYSL